MKIALGSDHAGFELKEKIKQKLQSQRITIDDRGTHSADSCDYPDYAQAVADQAAVHNADWGILVCGTGIGMSMAANKVPSIRAARVVTEATMGIGHSRCARTVREGGIQVAESGSLDGDRSAEYL